MDKVAMGIGGTVVVAAMMFVFPTVGVLFGAFGGWVVGMFWPRTSAAWLAYFHVPLAMWQVGALFGFVGAYARSTYTSKAGNA